MKADSNSNNMNALVAQLDRVTGYEPVGRGFESLQARQAKKTSQNVMSFLLSREGQSLGISCHWHDIFILPPLQARQKKHCELQCFFFFYTAIETLSFSHFHWKSQSVLRLQNLKSVHFSKSAHNPPLFCKSKTTPAFFDHRQKSHPRAPTVVSFLILTQKSYHNFVFQNLSIIR